MLIEFHQVFDRTSGVSHAHQAGEPVDTLS